MPAYDIPKTGYYPINLVNPPAIEQRLSGEEFKTLKRSPLEMVLAQNKQNDTNAPCVVKGHSLDNCVDLVYKRAQSADEFYQGAKMTPRNTLYSSRYKFVEIDGKEWIDYFFEKGETSKKMHEILKHDQKINFESFYKLNLTYKNNIKKQKVGLFREGFLVIGVSDGNIGGFIIPISPETVDKIYSL